MIFTGQSHLSFQGLASIQSHLENTSEPLADGYLLVVASLPSLSEQRWKELTESIQRSEYVIFWCFGDFIWNLPSWQSLEPILKGKHVGWVVASQRWKNIAGEILEEESLILHPHPFSLAPVTERWQIRKELGLTAEQQLILFAGRRNVSKNLPKLWSAFKSGLDAGKDWVLGLVGPWCDYGNSDSHTLGRSWDFLCEVYPKQTMDFGIQDPSRVHSLMLAADVVVSLSTFEEEDFGLAIREARSLGTPVVASNWGGHYDMNTDPSCFLVGIDADTLSIFQTLIVASASPRTIKDYQMPIKIVWEDLKPFRGLRTNGERLKDLRFVKTIMAGF